MKNLNLTVAAILASAGLLLTGCSTTPEASTTEAPAASVSVETVSPMDLCLESLKGLYVGEGEQPADDLRINQMTCNDYETAFKAGNITEEQFAGASDHVAQAKTNQAKQDMGAGDYEFFTPSGAEGTFTLPGKVDQESEKLRKIAGAPEVTYIEVTYDNRQGSELSNPDTVQLFDDEGTKYEFRTMPSIYEEWKQMLPEEHEASTFNLFVDAYNEALDSTEVGEKSKYLMALEGEIPESITRVALYPSSTFEPVEVYPSIEMDSSN